MRTTSRQPVDHERAHAGVFVPDDVIAEMAAAPKGDEKKASAAIAARLMREMKGMCKGFHLMPLGWSKPAVQAIEDAGLL